MENNLTGDVFKTGDLPLAAYFRLRGIRHMTMELVENPETNKDVAEWIFTVNPRFKNLLDDYQKGDAMVEPRRYAAALRTTRNELYTFLGYVEGTDEG